MAHIKITKGIDLPILGKPEGEPRSLQLSGESGPMAQPAVAALDLSPFHNIKLIQLINEGESVKIGQPLAEDQKHPGRFFVSPAGGIIRTIRRGIKGRLLNISIETSKQEEFVQFQPLDPAQASREQLISRFKAAGIFSKIRQRPFNILANPDIAPRSIFVKAIETAPFIPSSEIQVKGHEKAFQAGLDALAKLTDGSVHLVYGSHSDFQPFVQAQRVKKHTIEGPHPAGTHSVHIHFIDPVKSPHDIIWTLNAHDVVAAGKALLEGRYYHERIVGIGGPGVLADRTGYFYVREGVPINALISGRLDKGHYRLISGDPLNGKKVSGSDYLGFSDFAFSVIPDYEEREFLYFMRPGLDRYSASSAYPSGHFNFHKEYNFTTSLHGEPRPFVDATMYDKVMPMNIPVMHLTKAVMAEDYSLAEAYGLLEVDSEDFALATFVCPSKMEITEIIKSGLKIDAEHHLN